MTAQYQRLLVPVNGTEGDDAALSVVGHLTHGHPVAITLIFVVEVVQSMPLDAELPQEIDRGERILHRAEELAKSETNHKLSDVSTELLQARAAGAAIVDEAIDRRSDAIVLAALIRQKLGKPSLGETVGYVLKNAPCEVILIRQAFEDVEAEEDVEA
jgi:nucleotide-binding universal stress UspA family protein